METTLAKQQTAALCVVVCFHPGGVHTHAHKCTPNIQHMHTAKGRTTKCQHSSVAIMIISKQHWMPRACLFLLILTQRACSFLPAPQNVTVVSVNLEHRLTWRPGPRAPTSVQFRVQVYRERRKLWVPVSNCSELQTGEPCDLTNSFKNVYSVHLARVQAFTPEHESNWTCSKPFQPLLETTVGPPVVSLIGCGNCLLMQLSPPTSRGLHHSLLDYFFREYIVNVSRTRDQAQFTLRATSGETRINYLEKGVQYCVTARPLFRTNPPALLGGPYCAFTSPGTDSAVPVIWGLLCGLMVLMVLACTTLIRCLNPFNKHQSRTLV